MFESIFVSTLSVVLAEMGDKTQLLAFLLAARFHRSVPIVLGIFVATLLNHGLAGALGAWITTVLGPTTLKFLLVGGFWAMAVWMLVPDKEDGGLLDNRRSCRPLRQRHRRCLRHDAWHAYCRCAGNLFRRYPCQETSDSADSHCLCRPLFCARCRGARGLTTEPFLFPRPRARSA